MAGIESTSLPPAIVHADRWATFLGLLSALFVTLAIISLAAALFAHKLISGEANSEGVANTVVSVRALCGLISGGSMLAVAGLLPAWLIVSARVRVAEAYDVARIARQHKASQALAVSADPTSDPARPGVALFSGSPDDQSVIAGEEALLLRLAGWPQALACIIASAAAIAVTAWFLPRSAGTAGAMAVGIIAIALSLPVLICERRFALAERGDLPEGSDLMRLLRAMLWALLGGGICCVAQALGLAFALWGLWALAALIVMIAAELLLRALATPFLPNARTGVRALGESTVAHLVLARLDPVQGLSGGLKDRFGIDLSQSWALGFIRRAFAPLFFAMLLFAWLLTGITVLDISERGVYERFGKADSVLQPGLHLHLPWPLGIVQRIDNGQMHSVALTATDHKPSTPDQLGSDEETPPSYDRLWNQEHPTDSVYIVPELGVGTRDTKVDGTPAQSCQVLNSDVSIVYRVGLDDASAKDSLYHLENPELQVRNQAQRILIQEFATRTLIQVIEADRAYLIDTFRTALQQSLDRIGSGIEVIAIVIDGIHPPAAAAEAYHSVHAMEIQANTSVQTAIGDRARLLSNADQDAQVALDNAHAMAAEHIDEAHAEGHRFEDQVTSFKEHGQALMLERWLDTLSRSFMDGRLIIIDHRLQYTGPTIDLRRFAPATDNKGL